MGRGDESSRASASPEALKAPWLERLDDLVARVEAWGHEADWSTRRIEKRMKGPETGPYLAPALLLQHEFVRVLLEPIARSAPGAEGVVDLYLMPAYDDIARLFFIDGDWFVYPFDHWHAVEVNSVGDTEHHPKPFSKASILGALDERKAHAG